MVFSLVGRFLRAERWTHKSDDGWLIVVLADRNKESKLSCLTRNCPPEMAFPPKHTLIEITFDMPLNNRQPEIVLRTGEIRARRIRSLQPLQTSGMGAATPESPGPEDSQ